MTDIKSCLKTSSLRLPIFVRKIIDWKRIISPISIILILLFILRNSKTLVCLSSSMKFDVRQKQKGIDLRPLERHTRVILMNSKEYYSRLKIKIIQFGWRIFFLSYLTEISSLLKISSDSKDVSCTRRYLQLAKRSAELLILMNPRSYRNSLFISYH